ncbi:MAG: haloacid dehalogenase type II [Acetobacteraceae bacterium]|nr:haloacid dehalogenase type II [Acetobacteraceae bacterium]MBV8574092.1 haloacid dehalogenase type II [Acetobacteraceae bacterium]
MLSVRFLGFDVFGTVVDWRTSVARELSAFLGQHGSDLDPEALADAWRGLYQPSMEAVRSGQRPWVRLSLLHEETLDAVLKQHGFDVSRVSREELRNLARGWERLDPWPDAVEGLHRLKKRFVIGPISNGNVSLMVWMAKFGQLPWDVIAGAEPTQAYKPQPQAYLGSAALLGLPPQEVALVAAHNDDLAAARACGLKTIFIPRPREHGPHQRTDLAPEQDWDIVAENMIALADQLDC